LIIGMSTLVIHVGYWGLWALQQRNIEAAVDQAALVAPTANAARQAKATAAALGYVNGENGTTDRPPRGGPL
jgi:hypothetical protein